MLTLGLNYVVVSVLVAVFLLVCVGMILIVLIQRPQGGGLSGAFGSGGGDGAGQTAFGTKTGDVLTITTIGIFVIYLALAVGLNFVTKPATITGGPAITAPEGEAAATDVISEDDIENAEGVIDDADGTATEAGDDAAAEALEDEAATEPVEAPDESPATEPEPAPESTP